MSKSYRPLGNRILVKRDDAVTTTPGGLHLPAVAQAKSDRGVVKYVGPGGVDLSTGRRIEVSVKPGDVVIFPKSAIEIEVGGEKLVMLQEPEVFAVEFESEEAAAAFKGAAGGAGGSAEAVPAVTTTPSGRRRRSDAGVKRGKRSAGVVNVTLNTTAPTSSADAVADATVEKVVTTMLDRPAQEAV